LYISQANADKIKQLFYRDGNNQTKDGNWRRTQPINGRDISLVKVSYNLLNKSGLILACQLIVLLSFVGHIFIG